MSVPPLAIPTAAPSGTSSAAPKTLSQVLAAKRAHRHFQWSSVHITKANSTPLLNSWDYATPRRPANPEATVISSFELKSRLAAIRHEEDVQAMLALESETSPISDHDDHSNTDTDATVPSPTSSPDTQSADEHHHESDAEHTHGTLSISLPVSITTSGSDDTMARRGVRSMPSSRVAALSVPLQSMVPSTTTGVRVSSSVPSRTSFGSPSLVSEKAGDRSLMQSPLPMLPPRQLSNNYVSSTSVNNTNTNNANNAAIVHTRTLSKTSSTASYNSYLNKDNNNNNNNNNNIMNGKVTYVTLPSLDHRYHQPINGNGQYVYTSSPSQTTATTTSSAHNSPVPPKHARRSTGSSILSALQRWVR